MARRSSKTQRRQRRFYAILVTTIVLLAAILFFLDPGPESEPGTVPITAQEPSSRTVDSRGSDETDASAGPPMEQHRSAEGGESEVIREMPAVNEESARVSIIIDDVGYREELLDKACAISFPLTFAVLPMLPHSAGSASRLHHTGFEVMLHLPMEPENYPENNPGAGALFTFMTPDEIVRTLHQDLLSVPHVRGVNNHMGSKFCVRENLMKIVLRELKRRDLFFIDSRTTAQTVGFHTAGALGLNRAERSVFIDQDPSPVVILDQLNKLFEEAELHTYAIGIAHFRDETLDLLISTVPKLLVEHPDVRLVYASDLVN